MALRIALTNLAGEQLAVFEQYSDALVSIPYNDARTAQVTVPALDPLAEQVEALSTMLKVWYVWPDRTRHLVFWGPVLTPTWSYKVGSKTLQIQAHDMSIRLKHAYLPDDTAIDVSSSGLAALISAADDGALGIGIGTTGGGSGGTLNGKKGDEIWSRMTEIGNDPQACDFRLRPDDSTPGQYALLDTMDKAETEDGGARDKRLSVIFQAGFGIENVEEFTYSPQGEAVRNRAVIVQAQSDPDDPDLQADRTNPTSIAKYGTYTYWEAGGFDEAGGSGSTLDGKAMAELLAYSVPPKNFTLTPKADETQNFIYGRDYEEADVISCAAHFGGLRLWLPGFINEVRLRQRNATGLTTAEIEAIPEASELDNIA